MNLLNEIWYKDVLYNIRQATMHTYNECRAIRGNLRFLGLPLLLLFVCYCYCRRNSSLLFIILCVFCVYVIRHTYTCMNGNINGLTKRKSFFLYVPVVVVNVNAYLI